ncbi:hypothetical protein D3C86_1222870 [compost metagenome]
MLLRARLGIYDAQRNTIRLLSYTGRAFPRAYSARAQAIRDSREQQLLEAPAVDRVLGPAIPGRETSSLCPYQLPLPVVIAELCSWQADLREVISKSEFDELSNSVRWQVDTHADFANVLHGLEHFDVGKAGGMKTECRSQAADAGSSDAYFHLRSPSFARSTSERSDT